MDRNCNNQLRDSAGAESLKALYARKGAGSVSFGEKITNNLPVLGVGIGRWSVINLKTKKAEPEGSASLQILVFGKVSFW